MNRKGRKEDEEIIIASMSSVWERLQEASEFFEKRGKVHTTLERLARRLDAESIPYAVIGGMALNLHGYEHVTGDLNVLMTSIGLEKFDDQCVERGEYTRAFPGAKRSFVDIISQVSIKIITTGEYPGDGKPKPVAFPDPATASVSIGGIRVIKLEKLIDLKLASGLSAPHRLRDLADVQDLILAQNLPLEFEEELDESVRTEYRRLWELAQHANEGPGERE